MNKSENRGGKRDGAGRPKTGNARIKSSITIDADLYQWIKKQPEKLSSLVNKGLLLIKKGTY